MPKVKLPRKSTSIDMTAMCDVAFLLLAFFILTTKFKPVEALTVMPPKSVQTKPVDQKNVVLITIDKDNKVYFSMSDDAPKMDVINAIAQARGLNLTEQQKKNFARSNSYVGVPFSQLPDFLTKSDAEVQALSKTKKLPGIPVMDSADNQIVDWMRAAQSAFAGGKMSLLVKGDNDAKYPAFKGVIDAFKKNDIFKFAMVTGQETVPPGTELYRKNFGGGEAKQ